MDLFSRNVDKQILVSSEELNKFYAITNKDGGMQMMRFHFTGKTVMESLQSSNSIVADHNNKGDSTPVYYPMCELKSEGNSSGSAIMVSTDGPCTGAKGSPLSWPIMKGFVTADKFYLFGDVQIFIFYRSVYDQPNKPVEYTVVLFSTFIECSGEVREDGKSELKFSIESLIFSSI